MGTHKSAKTPPAVGKIIRPFEVFHPASEVAEVKRGKKKIKMHKFQTWHYFYKKNNCSYSKKCNWNFCEMHGSWIMIYFSLPFLYGSNLFVMLWVSNQKLGEQSVCSRFAWRYSLSQYKRTLACLVKTQITITRSHCIQWSVVLNLGFAPLSK